MAFWTAPPSGCFLLSHFTAQNTHTNTHTHSHIQALLYDHQIVLPSAHSVNYTGASHKNKEQINTLKTEKSRLVGGALKGTGHNTAQCPETEREGEKERKRESVDYNV